MWRGVQYVLNVYDTVCRLDRYVLVVTCFCLCPFNPKQNNPGLFYLSRVNKCLLIDCEEESRKLKNESCSVYSHSITNSFVSLRFYDNSLSLGKA